MRITWLLEVADQLWGGVKVALEDANWLSRRGHDVSVVSRSAPPTWMQIECAFRQVPDFRAEHLPDADVLIGTFWTTVPWAAGAGAQKGAPVHFCQGYEGDNPENEALRDRIEATYRLPGVRHVTIAPHLTRLLQQRFGITACEVPYAIDHRVHHPAADRAVGSPLRVGLVGPYQLAWKDLATGYAACRLAHAAGKPLVLVRASNTPPANGERDQPFPVEWHQQLPPAAMGDFYRSLDVFLGTSSGAEEGFFLPAIEAMACGVPAVLTDIPCFRGHAAQVGHDRYALFVPPRDPAAMAEALVLASSLPAVRSALRTAGLEVAAAYHPDRHGEHLEAALQRIAANHRPVHGAATLRPTGGTAPTIRDLLDGLLAAAAREHRRGDGSAAARLRMAAACLDPDDAALRQAAAADWLAAGDPAQALLLYDDLARHGADDEALHQGRGRALHALGRMREAAQAFRAALAVGARNADAYNQLGVVLFQSGDVPGARQSFERALMLEPLHRDARDNLQELPAA